jgi:hypothetical protein
VGWHPARTAVHHCLLARGFRSARAVDVRSVVDVNDVDPLRLVVDAVQHAVGTAARTKQAAEFALEGLADAVRLAGQVAERELDNRPDDTGRDALQHAPSWAGELDVISHAAGSAVPLRHAELGTDVVLAVGTSGRDVSLGLGDGVPDARLR